MLGVVIQQRADDSMGTLFGEWRMLREQAVPHSTVDQIAHYLTIGIGRQFATLDPLVQNSEERLASHENELCAKEGREYWIALCFCHQTSDNLPCIPIERLEQCFQPYFQ